MRGARVSDQGRLVAGRYRLAEPIGRGGMGTVWRAEDELLGRQVAVKKLRVPPELQDDELERLYERTRREARSAARITHPNVVVVHDVVEDEGLPCVVMEYVPSRTLSDVIKNDGPLDPREAARIGRGMVAALRAAHRAGVLHRDVKPANVLLGPEADEGDEGWPGGRIVLTDFGIASATGTSTLTRTGELIGSFDYLAPERITGGTPGPASDLWALGATLYQALEGTAPFHRDTPIETAYAIASEPMPPPRNAGPLAPLIASLLEKEPERRMPAEQVERLLVSSAETVLYPRTHGADGYTPPPGTPRPTPSWARTGPDEGDDATRNIPRQVTGHRAQDGSPHDPAATPAAPTPPRLPATPPRLPATPPRPPATPAGPPGAPHPPAGRTPPGSGTPPPSARSPPGTPPRAPSNTVRRAGTGAGGGGRCCWGSCSARVCWAPARSWPTRANSPGSRAVPAPGPARRRHTPPPAHRRPPPRRPGTARCTRGPATRWRCRTTGRAAPGRAARWTTSRRTAGPV